MRRITVRSVAVLAVSALAACTTFFDTDIPPDDVILSDAGNDATGDATGDAPGDVPSDVETDTPTDVPVDVDVDADVGDADIDVRDTDADVPPPENLCGGDEPLEWDGVFVEAGDACGPCNDGVLVCVSERDVDCSRASATNACGGCGPLPAEVGDPCGRCGGEWTCGGDGTLTCSVESNACGGCGTLDDAPGQPCDTNGDTTFDGATQCVAPDLVTCVTAGVNACGGAEPLTGAVGDPCGACGLGILVCDGDNALTCDGEDTGLNACGGCTALAGQPEDRCGACRGTYACDGTDAVFCEEPLRNLCGGCSDLGEDVPGTLCGDGTFWACDGLDALECPSETRNACGGSLVLAQDPGETCGPCDDGYLVCSSPNSVTCMGSTETNACGGCGFLPAPLGSACGTRGAWACDGETNAPICQTDPDRNACGGEAPLDRRPGTACGVCDTGVVACDGADGTVCVGESPDALRTFYTDGDLDGFGDPESDPVEACAITEGLAANDEDCDDASDRTYPGAPELCDTSDNDCDEETDEEVVDLAWYPDEDDDTYGDGTAEPQLACAQPDGFVLDATDCDDSVGTTNPGALEVCNTVDDNCSGVPDEGVANACGGCAELSPPVGELCGPCLLDQFVCDGIDGTVCSGATPCPAPELSTDDVDTITGTTATLHGTVVSLPDFASEYGFCWALASANAVPSPSTGTCEIVAGAPVEGPFELEVSELSPGSRYVVRAYLVAGGESLYGNVASFSTQGQAPTGVVATDGAFVDRVDVTWDAVPGALGFRVLRDGEEIGSTEGDTTMFSDTDAVAGPAPTAPTNVLGTDDSAEEVQFVWEAPALSPGPAASYSVRAVFDAGPGDISAPDSGFRAGAPIDGYEVQRDGGEWVDVGTDTSLRIDDAPNGTIDGATASASDGTAASIALSVSDVRTSPGAPVSLRVRARNASGVGAASTAATGALIVGDMAATWEQSATDADGDYAAIGSTGMTTDFTPPDGTGPRYYRARVMAVGADEFVTAGDRGFVASVPVVALDAIDDVTTTTAGVGLQVLAVGGPPATSHGVCWSVRATPSPDDESSSCIDRGTPSAVGTEALTLTDLAAGETYFVRAFAVHEGSIYFSDAQTFVTVPPAPTGLIASQGDDTEGVLLTWDATLGATSYGVYRDGERIATADAPLWDDSDAEPAPAPSGNGFRLEASQGTHTDRVVLTWEAPDVSPGPLATYYVEAINASGTSAPSEPADGWRGAPPIAGYEVAVDGAFAPVGDVLTWDHDDAPSGSISAGVALASAGTSSSFVALEIAEDRVEPGPSVTYQVRAIGGDASPLATGFRGIGEPTYAWERSAGEADTDFSPLPGATTRAFEDTTAPADGSTRWYQCVISAEGAESATSEPAEGFRNSQLPAIVTAAPQAVTADAATLHGEALDLGSSAVTAHGFCWGSTANPSLTDDTSTCESLGALGDARGFSLRIDTLNAGAGVQFRAYATNAAGTAYGGNIAFVTVPPAPEGVTATDGTAQDRVTVTWTAAPGASAYQLFRDDVLLTEVATPRHDDTTAAAPGPPSIVGMEVAASENRTDRVDVTWTVPPLVGGGTHSYTVRAVNASGTSPASEPDTGFRGALPLTGYEISIDEGAWQPVAGTTFSDTTAPAGTLVGGTASASDGTSTTVQLALSGQSSAAGATRSYRVRAVNSAGSSAPSTEDTGRRVVGPLSYQWQRSTAGEGPWNNLSGATTPSFSDGSAPQSGALRHYRCQVSAEGAATVSSSSDTGFRQSLPVLSTQSIVGPVTDEATVSSLVTSLGAPAATSVGVCFSATEASPSPSNGATCVPGTTPAEGGTFSATVDGLNAGVTYRAQAFATNAFGTALGGVITVLTPPASPTNLLASDGAFADRVQLTWTAVNGATEYVVLRDGAQVAVVGAANYSDTSADAGGAPLADFATLSATQGTSPTGVTVTWGAPTVPPGTTHAYAVRARNAAGESAASGTDDGFRGPAPISAYQIRVGGGAWTSVGTATSFADTTAPAGSITRGNAVASDGTSPSFVSLTLSATNTVDGAAVEYLVRAVNAAGDGAASAPVSGRRGVGPLQYQWQRSSGPSPDGFTPIPGATTASYQDTGAPASGETRHYRCALSAEGASPTTSISDSGYRNADVPAVATNPATNITGTTATLNGDLIDFGTPAATTYGFCFATSPAPDFSDTCVTLPGAPSATGPFSTNITGLTRGVTYYAAAFAENAAGVSFGGSATVITTPPAPTGVNASDGVSPDYVQVDWAPVPGATEYVVLRNGVEIVRLPGTGFVDNGAPAPGPPGSDITITASTSFSDRVEITWGPPTPTDGATATYQVIAVNVTGQGPPSVSDTGYRAATPIDHYLFERTVSGGPATSFSVGLSTNYVDTDAPAGSVVAGSVIASDGNPAVDGVRVQLIGAGAQPGASVAYRVAAVSSTGELGGWSANASGQRTPGSTSVAWQRSLADENNGYSSLAVGSTVDFVDSDAPENGAGRYYRAQVTAAGASTAITVPNRGWRFPDDCPSTVDEPDADQLDCDGDGIDGDRDGSIFVSATEGSASGDGTFDNPVRTISDGVSLAASLGIPNVLIQAGNYQEEVALPDGVSLWGGYSNKFLVHDPSAHTTTILSPTPRAITIASYMQDGTIDGLTISASGATSASGRYSSAAIAARDVTGSLDITRSTLEAGSGLDGMHGGDGRKGSSGSKGSAAARGSGGSGGSASCGVGGGDGGDGPTSGGGDNGLPGDDLTSSGAPGGGGRGGNAATARTFSCSLSATPGANGGFGDDGFFGAPGPAPHDQRYGTVIGSLGDLDWRAGSGLSGDDGTAGGGGGGGGSGGGGANNSSMCNGTGGAGGGGGAGGCGGEGGHGGTGAGGSFGVLGTHIPGLRLINVGIRTGGGGTGGDGGDGGDGGGGGSGGQGEPGSPVHAGGAANGGNGGSGGDGGDGGGGGGGGGGASVGLFIIDGDLPVRTGVTYAIGTGGSGGGGGAGTTGAGATGRRGLSEDFVQLSQSGRPPGVACSEHWQCHFGNCASGVCTRGGAVQAAAGTFTMGSPTSESGRDTDELQHSVTLTRGFMIHKVPVTESERIAMLGASTATTSCPTCPSTTLSWYEALLLANQRSRADGTDRCYDLSSCSGHPHRSTFTCAAVPAPDLNCNGTRLPTEAEWEYAARAGTNTAWACGSNDSCLSSYAVYDRGSPDAVASLNPNAWSIYDMSGNALEWVWDFYDGGYAAGSMTDPTGPATGARRVQRGGAYFSNASGVRSAERLERSPTSRSYSTTRYVQTVPNAALNGEACTSDWGCGSGFCGHDGTCANEDTWSANVTAAGATPAMCSEFETFRAGLRTGAYVGVYFGGTNGGVGCYDPSAVEAIAQALQNGTDMQVSCDGHTWNTCDRGSSGLELWIDAPSVCAAGNCPDPGIVLRACEGGTKWGGVNTDTCDGVPQNVYVSFSIEE